MTRALEFYQLALAKMPEDALRYRALTLNALGAVYRDLSQPAAAIDVFTKALEHSRASADRFQEASSLYYLAEAAASAGDLGAARSNLERAIGLAESLRGRVLSRDLRASYLASVHDYYELYIDVLMRASTGSESLIEEAFRVSERARARSLLESLAESRIDIRKGVEEDLLARELRVREIYNAKALREMELLEQRGDKAQLDPLEDEMALLAAEYDRIQSQIRSGSPNFATLTQPEPSTIQEIQRNLLDDDSLLLEFALGKERSFLWVVSNKGVAAATLPGRSEIEGRARRLYELLTTRQRQGDKSPSQWRRQLQQADSDYAREARELGRILLGPAESEIRQHNRLVIAAEGSLQYVPFGALPFGDDEGAGDEDVPLILRHQVVRGPSASVIAAIRRGRTKQTPGVSKIAVFADPVFGSEDSRIGTRGAQFRVQEESAPLQLSMARLAATRLEAEAIQSVAPAGSVLLATGLEASRERVMDPGLGDYDVVHFATHGILNDERPELSGIVLSMVDERGSPRDGFLRLHDIYNLTLPAQLVVLSACDTALGKLLRGEGLVGLVRGFMYAGASSVVASLWKVDDEATKELMTLFYKHLLSEDMDPAAALRAAQISLLRDEDFRRPYYWAAFELHGDWR
jgi:CHAT domain-containing protein